ncbi:MAG: hypothetical protein LBC70_04020 [Chitinispirillales bacterium]|jgi:phage tail-like protein|nr:hypothetical protein [Chitinispirillales bacterium]
MEEQKIYYSPKSFDGFNEGRRFISSVFDSENPGTEWDRLKLEICPKANNSVPVKIKLRVYISDDALLLEDGKGHVPEEPFIISEFTDILLYGNGKKGKYLRFEVELLDERETFFNAYELTFPKLSFVRYLPAVYHGNETLERFLAIYQNQYLDAEREIMNFHRQLNARETDMLNQLAELTGGEMFLRLPENKLRKLLDVIALLYRTKGTKNCVKRLVYALTDEIPVIIDCADELTESVREVFEAQSGHFYLILKSSPPDIDLELFNYLIKQFIPINARYTTVFLDEKRRAIGGFCFLGVNTILSDEKPLIAGASTLEGNLTL